MGSAGIRLHLKPGQTVSSLLDDAIIGDRMIRVRFAMLAYTHLVAIRCLVLDQPCGNLVLTLAWNTFYQGPIGFLGIAFTKSSSQCLCRAACPRYHQHAGRVAVETMHETWLLAFFVPPCFQ